MLQSLLLQILMLLVQLLVIAAKLSMGKSLMVAAVASSLVVDVGAGALERRLGAAG